MHPAYQTSPPFTGFSQISPTALLTPQNVAATNFSSNPYAYASSFHPLSGNNTVMQGKLHTNFTQHNNSVQAPNSEATPSASSSSAVTTDQKNPYSPNFNSSFINTGMSHIEVSSDVVHDGMHGTNSGTQSSTHSGRPHNGQNFTNNGAPYRVDQGFQNFKTKTKSGGKQNYNTPSSQKQKNQKIGSSHNIESSTSNNHSNNNDVNKIHSMKTKNNNHEANPHLVPSQVSPISITHHLSNQPNSSKNNNKANTPFSYASMLTNKPVTNPPPPVQTANAAETATSSANSSMKQDAYTVESTLQCVQKFVAGSEI